MKNAEFLTVEGKPIKVGGTYYTVNTYAPYSLLENKASSENNCTDRCYFLDKSKAKHFQWLLKSKELINTQIIDIKNYHFNR